MMQSKLFRVNLLFKFIFMDKKPLILVTNDDGITAPGMRTLISVMNEIGEETKIEQICKVDIVDQLGAEYEKQKSVINNLKKHIDDLASSS